MIRPRTRSQLIRVLGCADQVYHKKSNDYEVIYIIEQILLHDDERFTDIEYDKLLRDLRAIIGVQSDTKVGYKAKYVSHNYNMYEEGLVCVDKYNNVRYLGEVRDGSNRHETTMSSLGFELDKDLYLYDADERKLLLKQFVMFLNKNYWNESKCLGNWKQLNSVGSVTRKNYALGINFVFKGGLYMFNDEGLNKKVKVLSNMYLADYARRVKEGSEGNVYVD